MLVNPDIIMNNILQKKKKVLQAIMDSYDKLTSHDDEDDDTYEEDI